VDLLVRADRVRGLEHVAVDHHAARVDAGLRQHRERHLEAPLGGVRRLDAVVASSLDPGVEHRLEDVPFDPRTGEVIWLPKVAAVKLEPANTLRVTLLSIEDGGAREVGRYAFHHRPWPG